MTPLLTVALASAAGPAELGLVARSQASIDLADDRATEDSLSLDTWLRARAAGDTGQDGRWTLSLVGVHGLRHGEDTDALWSVRPGESVWDGPLGPLRLRAGLVDVRWGRLDLLPVADVMGAHDLRAGPLTPPEVGRVALPGAALSASLGQRARAELVALPFGGADRVALIGSDWSLVRQGQIEALSEEMATWEGDALSGPLLSELVAGVASGLAASQDDLLTAALAGANEGLDARSPGQAVEIAGRVGLDLGPADLRAFGGAVRSRAPQLRLDPTLAGLLRESRLPTTAELAELEAVEAPIEVAYPRTWMAGAEAGALVGPVGVRAEAIWRSARPWQGPWLEAGTTPAVAAGVGLDWAPRPALALAVEGSVERLLDAPDALLLDRALEVNLGGVISARLLSERLGLLVAGVYAASFQEHLIRAGASWRLSDAFEVALGGVALGGGPAPAPATLDQALAWSGGPFSYWGDNDAATLSVAWIR